MLLFKLQATAKFIIFAFLHTCTILLAYGADIIIKYIQPVISRTYVLCSVYIDVYLIFNRSRCMQVVYQTSHLFNRENMYVCINVSVAAPTRDGKQNRPIHELKLTIARIANRELYVLQNAEECS